MTRRRPVSTLGRVIDVAVALGVPRGPLDRIRGSEEWLDLPVPERIRRAEAVWTSILAALPERAFPLDYAGAIEPDDFGLLGLAMRTAPDLRHALQRILNFQGLFTPQPPWAFRDPEGPGTVALELRPRLSADEALHHALAATWVAELTSLVRQVTGEPFAPRRVGLPGAPPGALDDYEAFFGVRPAVGAAWTGLVLDAELLDRPLLRADAGVSAFLLEQLQALADAEARARTPSLDERLRPIIAAALADGGPPSMETVASRMGMSTRTLRRRLQERDQTWSALVEETRRELALSLLRDPGTELAECAWLLGYSEPSAFFRAFRRWTGRTPSEWREGRAPEP